MNEKQKTEAEGAAPKKKRARSPAYPGIDLEAALDRAETLRTKQGSHWATVDEIFHHWGFKKASSVGHVELSALNKFGLVEYQGHGKSKKARLTDAARSILLDARPESRERMQHIQEAALRPEIHKDLWDQYKTDWPDDSHLDYHLRMDRGFTDSGAKDFIEQYKRTLAFARLLESGITEADGSDKRPHEGEGIMAPETLSPPAPASPETPPSAVNAQVRTIQVPLSGASWVLLQAAFPMAGDDWDQMLAVLEAMKPGLVVQEKKQKSK